jgi:hypothetical protein
MPIHKFHGLPCLKSILFLFIGPILNLTRHKKNTWLFSDIFNVPARDIYTNIPQMRLCESELNSTICPAAATYWRQRRDDSFALRPQRFFHLGTVENLLQISWSRMGK